MEVVRANEWNSHSGRCFDCTCE